MPIIKQKATKNHASHITQSTTITGQSCTKCQTCGQLMKIIAEQNKIIALGMGHAQKDTGADLQKRLKAISAMFRCT